MARWRRSAHACAHALTVLVAVAFLQLPVAAAGRTPTVAVEAAFLVNFMRFTQWPAERLPTDDNPYIVAVVGSEAAADTIRTVVSAADGIQGHPIAVVDVDPSDVERRQAKALEVLRGSHLVFVQSNDSDVRRQVFDTLDGSAVLTVGDTPDFAARGGMLGLVRSGSHLALEANPEQMQSAGVQVSAKVLKLARIRRNPSS
jgi:hypothetical protein